MNEFRFRSVNKLLEESFRKNWDRLALSNYRGVSLCYRDVARRIEKLHIAFEKCFLHKGDKVAICARNQVNWAVSYLAAMTYGAVPVPILHEFKPGNIHYLVNHSEAKVLFVDDVVWEGTQRRRDAGTVRGGAHQHLPAAIFKGSPHHGGKGTHE